MTMRPLSVRAASLLSAFILQWTAAPALAQQPPPRGISGFLSRGREPGGAGEPFSLRWERLPGGTLQQLLQRAEEAPLVVLPQQRSQGEPHQIRRGTLRRDLPELIQESSL